jgi:ribosomal protein S18
VEWVDYKDVTLLRTHMSDRGKIRARHVTGNCARHQGEIAAAIKTARDLVLLPYGKDKTTDTTEPSPPLQMSGPTGGVHP